MSSPDRAPGRVLGRWLGEAEPRLLGQGMEGAVYEIDDTRVAKVWFAASAERLRRLAAFYDALATKSFSFSVPRIAEVATVEGWAITIERRLAGDSLASTSELSISGVSISEVRRADAGAVLVEVVAEIAAAGELPAARELPVLDEEMPLFAGPADFPAALAGLAARRVRRFRPVLGGAVDHLAEKAAALAGRLVEIDSGRRAVIHGDLVPANIVVDGGGRASAVLDWGFLSAEGDPAFDAAVAAAIFDMYGPDAPRTEQALLDRMQDRMGYDRTAMLVYRAAYSLITANAYDPLGRDGHFAWCVAALNRADVTRALLG
jgi:aminoglycoside phosphotransferase (APT) family kinase protein